MKLIANEAEALRENQVTDARYLYCLLIVSLFAVITAIGFVVVLYFLLRRQSSAKAPITRAPSESAYDNPTYKVFNYFQFNPFFQLLKLFFSDRHTKWENDR